jgi:hypothetical protein
MRGAIDSATRNHGGAQCAGVGAVVVTHERRSVYTRAASLLQTTEDVKEAVRLMIFKSGVDPGADQCVG